MGRHPLILSVFARGGMPDDQIFQNDVITFAAKHLHYVEYPYAKPTSDTDLSANVLAARTRDAVCQMFL